MSVEGELAIEVRGARKSYGRMEILKGLNMNVPYASIYGLLGSSGCGKTTLLRCILGRLGLASGTILTLGRPPGSSGHGVPGRDVGYMPQELALYGDFTMLETMYYFGILHHMGRSEVKARGEFLLNLLDLPTHSRVIKKLSGGQQRRVSFAVAMLQEPPLLILDEPTVGVDPLLRARIWRHLLELVSSQQTTIIITTHYIEEARQAHVVGLMRDGLLLAESPPDTLIQSYSMTNLEDVFLRLCQREDEGDLVVLSGRHSIQSPVDLDGEDKRTSSFDSDETTPLLHSGRSREGDLEKSTVTVAVAGTLRQTYRSLKQSACAGGCLPRPMNVLAMCWKNAVHIYRNLWLLFFQFILPMLQVTLFCWAVGRNLKGVRVAYVNADVGRNGSVCNYSEPLGDLFISNLKQGNTFAMHEYHSVDHAVHVVQKGEAWVAITIGKNFTEDLYQRAKNTLTPSPPDVVKGSTIELYMDVTNAQITVTVQNKTLQAMEEFLEELLKGCDIPSSLFASPLQIHHPPVYGTLELSFTDFMGPGVISSIMFGISIGLTAVSLIRERKEGLIDRTWVAGVNVTEIIIAQVVTQLFILIVQIILVLVVVLYAFKVYNVYTRNIGLIALLALLQGLAGMSLGLVISAVCDSESSALQLAIASFYPAILLSGIMWPLEGMPTFLRDISYGLPATLAAQAMRAIMGRGWGLFHYEVWRGFVVTILWFLSFLLFAGVAMRIRK